MKKMLSPVLAMALLLSTASFAFAEESTNTNPVDPKARMEALYGENHQITDDNYDKSLAVKCINGTFVGKKTDNVIAFKRIYIFKETGYR